MGWKSRSMRKGLKKTSLFPFRFDFVLQILSFRKEKRREKVHLQICSIYQYHPYRYLPVLLCPITPSGPLGALSYLIFLSHINEKGDR